MLSLSQIEMQYGTQVLFEDVNLNLIAGHRYGLVGANGAGKSTLLQLIAGLLQPNVGQISYPKTAKLGYLQQDHFQYEHDIVLDVVIQGNARLWQAMQEKQQLLDKEVHLPEDGVRLGQLEEIILGESGYEAAAFAHSLLTGLGIAAHAQEGPLSALSGGYKLRVLLAQVLFGQPDILLLDEPTNHLDIISIRWLAQFLSKCIDSVIVFVSHDRGFLDQVATHILDVDYHTVLPYPGNYTAFEASKAAAYAEQEKILQGQQEKIEQLQTFVKRFGAKASKARQAKAKQKQIDRIEQIKLKPSTRRAPNFKLKSVRPAGKVVLQVECLGKHFAEKEVLKEVSFTINRGEKIAIIGKNGLGKSTLLKILMNELKPAQGTFDWGYECHLAYFAQDHHDLLKVSQDVLTWLSQHSAGHTSAEVRRVLGQILFSNDTVYKSISALSGGEAARLLLARIILAAHNILILDEPTNHLDLEGMQALAEALVAYDGTVLIVSHDSYFVEKVAERIIALTETGIRDYTGTYSAYLQHYGELEDETHNKSAKQNKKAKKQKSGSARVQKLNSQQLKKQVGQLQDTIDRLESRIQHIDAQFADEVFYQQASSEEMKTLTHEKCELAEQLEKALAQWEMLAEQLEAP